MRRTRTLPRSSPHFKKEREVARPLTLFTGQWADWKLEELARRVAEFGYDGLELA